MPHSTTTWARGEPDAWEHARPVRECGPGKQTSRKAGTAPRSDPHYWAVDALQAEGANVHLVHPKGLNWEDRRVKNDYRDCCEMLDRMRAHRLPEAWIAPPAVRELRELVRHRAKLVALRTGLKAQVHAVLAKQGLHPPVKDVFGVAGNDYLDGLGLDESYALRVDSLRELIDAYDEQVAIFEQEISGWLRDDVGYWAIQALDGIGPIMAAIFVAEIGDVGRFPNPQTLCSWAGLTPKHKESDVKVQRGNITKQGSRLVRWAAVEAVAHAKGTAKIKADYQRIAARRGNKIARVAAARKLLTLVYFGLRDGEIRSLARVEDVG